MLDPLTNLCRGCNTPLSGRLYMPDSVVLGLGRYGKLDSLVSGDFTPSMGVMKLASAFTGAPGQGRKMQG